MTHYLNYPFIKRHRELVLREIEASEEGLEIGPYDKPWITKPDYNVKYYDRFTRQQLVEKANRNRNPDQIVDLDFVAENIGQIEGCFDYIFASHVFEHFPNPLDFLVSSYVKLKSQGRLFLVIPDCRYTFDICRPRTVVSDYIAAFLEQRVKPSPQTVFDSVYWGYGPVVHQELWANPEMRNLIKPSRNIGKAFDKASASLSAYVDCHVTITTPESFRKDMLELTDSGILRFDAVTVFETERNANDFLCVFRKS
jgi:hypothetical protein